MRARHNAKKGGPGSSARASGTGHSTAQHDIPQNTLFSAAVNFLMDWQPINTAPLECDLGALSPCFDARPGALRVLLQFGLVIVFLRIAFWLCHVEARLVF